MSLFESDIERVLLAPDAVVRALAPQLQVTGATVLRRPPSFRWTVESPDGRVESP